MAYLTVYTKRGSYGFFDVKNMEDKIMGGAFMLSRQIFTSKIWQDKPSSWKIIWIYILGQVNHKDNDRFKRGEGFFNFSRELSTKNIGCDITSDMIKKFLQFARSSSMVSTKRSTRGTIIKVLNYNKYQTLSNYESTTSSTSKAREKHEESTPINKNDKNVKKDTPPKISFLLLEAFKEITGITTPDGDYQMDNLFPAKRLAKKITEKIKEMGKITDIKNENIIDGFKTLLNAMDDFNQKRATSIGYIDRNFNKLFNLIKK